MTEEPGGPYLSTAVFCEKVLQEKDGVASVIRIVDRFIVTISASGSEPPEKMPPMTITTTAFLSFKSGFAKGSQVIKLVPRDPSGRPMAPEALLPVFFEGDDRGASVTVNVTFRVEEEGLYWFDVLLGDRLMTKIPLRVVYQRVSLGTQPGSV
ncbi:MAG: hypothetical protein HY726_11470 [Candidatus Rokubacteria bacterium]|nr:hypothetical protein [Candidatus Rokubacteria bacterium]